MAPRTRKTAATSVASADPEASIDPAPVETVDEGPVEVVVEAPAPVPVAVPDDDVDYVADQDFTATVGAQLVSFASGTKIDPLAGAYLLASGAPVSTVAKS